MCVCVSMPSAKVAMECAVCVVRIFHQHHRRRHRRFRHLKPGFYDLLQSRSICALISHSNVC